LFSQKTFIHWQPYQKLLKQYLMPYWLRVTVMAVMILTGIGLQLASPQVIRVFLDAAQSGGTKQLLLGAAVAFLVFSLAQEVFKLGANLLSQQVGWLATNRLRYDLFRHCLGLDMPFHKSHTPGEMIERIDGDVSQLANFFSQFSVQVAGNALLVVGILVMIGLENVWLGVGLGAFTLVILYLLGVIQRLAVPYWTRARQASADQYGFIEERLVGAEDIRTAGAEAYTLQRLYHLMRTFLIRTRSAWVVGSLSFNLTSLLFAVAYTVGLGLGVWLYLQGRASLGTAYLIFNYTGMLADPLQKIRGQLDDLQMASAVMGRINELFNLRLKAETSLGADGQSKLVDGALSVEFQNVSFHYDEDPHVLKEISFRLQPGRVLGLLGRTGSGKSTLTNLLFHLYEPTSGSIRLGGEELSAMPITQVRQRIGLVTQDVQLFHASLRDNLTFFNHSVADERLKQVLEQLDLWDWVQSRQGGLNGMLGAGGQGISAGEAQLVAFTRVFLKEPGVVILDEASSRLDPATEMRMERAVDRLFTGRTAILIAHRLKTVQRVDDILILEDGQVVEYGGRIELLKDSHSRFSRLLQTGLEEVTA
jgi:ATP-binding cassette subfamily B protein